MSMLIKNARLVSPDMDIPSAAVEIENGLIKAIYPNGAALPSCDDIYDADGKMVVPGFIDMHFHGGMGYEITSQDPRAVGIILEAKLREGVTSCCPTTLTLSEERLAESLGNIEAYRKNPTGSKVIGTHLEGPFINPMCAGAQNPSFLRNPDADELARLAAISKVSVITYAAELDKDGSFTAAVCRQGILPSCGHTNATAAEFRTVMANGLHRLTHFCNQMTKLHHREIGLVGEGLFEDSVYLEMICDTIHLAPDMIALTFKVKPIDRILLITDAMEATGLPNGDYQIGGLAVVVSDGAARLASNGALAGSTLQYNTALKNVLAITGKPISEVIKTTSWNQARELGISNLGKIEPGFIADLAVLDNDFNVTSVFTDGTKRF